MRMVWAGMTAAVLLAGLAMASASAQDTDGDLHSAAPRPKAWWDGWFAAPAKPVEKKADTVAASLSGAPSAAPVDLAAAARQRERDALDRRMEVCDRLMAVAVRNDDEAMQTQIEQLRERAWQLYQQRTAALPAGGAPSPEEAALDRRLGGAGSTRALTAPPAGKARPDDGQASLMREVK